MKLSLNKYNIKYIKRCAKNIKREQNLPYHQALNITVEKLGFNNWKHFLNEAEKCNNNSPHKINFAPKESIEGETRDPYRNLLVGAVNKLIEQNYISLDLGDVNEENEEGHIFCKIFGYSSVIIWRNIGFGELHISIWWKYNHNNHPQVNLKGNQKENFNLSQPLAKRNHYPKFVGVVVNCWLERKKGKYIQGTNRESIFDTYTRKGELKHLKELPILKPNGYEISGPFRF
ncbi:hypothetical protein [Polaribacter staleyi]|uniref:hypothetical protein n=1 Tax=Polaribacter staleyi TaxID=2022337 RepID=UPI0031B9CCD1